MIQPDPANGSADGKGPTTYYGYDADGNLKYETDPPGNTTSVGGTTYYFYDTLGRLVCTIDASADSSHGSWLASGVPDLAPAYSLGDDSTRTTYDALGDVASTEDQMGRTTVYVYDNLGRKTDMIQPDPATGQTSAPYENCPLTQYLLRPRRQPHLHDRSQRPHYLDGLRRPEPGKVHRRGAWAAVPPT